MGQRVAILGASKKPERFSYRAFRMLQEFGHTVIPVSPNFTELENVPTVASLGDIKGLVDTLTMYVGAPISSNLQNDILALRPGRVIFNPGSENSSLEQALTAAGINVVEACTLVMLRSNQF